MTGGWRGDAHTAPNYRGCAHEYVTDGRCSVCRAIPVDGFVQTTHLGNGATPLGSPNIMPAMTKGMAPTKGDSTSKPRFNYPVNASLRGRPGEVR